MTDHPDPLRTPDDAAHARHDAVHGDHGREASRPLEAWLGEALRGMAAGDAQDASAAAGHAPDGPHCDALPCDAARPEEARCDEALYDEALFDEALFDEAASIAALADLVERLAAGGGTLDAGDRAVDAHLLVAARGLWADVAGAAADVAAADVAAGSGAAAGPMEAVGAQRAAGGAAVLPAALREVLLGLVPAAPLARDMGPGGEAPASVAAHAAAPSAGPAVRHGGATPRGPSAVPLRVVDLQAAGPQAARRRVARAGSSRPWLRRALAAAALLVVGVSVLWPRGGTGRADAGVTPEFVRRLDWASSVRRMPSREQGRFLAVGEGLAAGDHEWLAVGFAGQGLVVVDATSRLEIQALHAVASATEHADVGAAASAAAAARGRGLHLLRARLRAAGRPVVGGLDAALGARAGEVRMATVDRALPLVVGDSGVFVLLEGAAHVVVDCGICAGPEGVPVRAPGDRATPLIALAPDSRALYLPLAWPQDEPRGGPEAAQAAEVLELAGGTRTLLRDGVPAPFGEAEASLFRELRFFGGVIPEGPLERRVPARALRRVDGAALPDGPARIVAAGAHVAWRWRVPRALAPADLLRLELHAPAGAILRLPQLDLEARLEPSGDEPGLASLGTPLPADWFDRLAGRALDLELHVAAGAPARVETLVFRQPPLGTARPSAAPAAEADPHGAAPRAAEGAPAATGPRPLRDGVDGHDEMGRDGTPGAPARPAPDAGDADALDAPADAPAEELR